MTRPRLPFVDLSDDDAAILRRAGFSQVAVYRWKHRRSGPSRIFLPRISAALGRDVLQPVPVAAQPLATDEPVVSDRMPSAPHAIPHRHIEINPCIDDGVCLAVRAAAMRPIANTLLDSRREIPCVNCREGIRRARAEAEKKRASAGRVGDICACGEPKSYGAVDCMACRDEKRRARA